MVLILALMESHSEQEGNDTVTEKNSNETVKMCPCNETDKAIDNSSMAKNAKDMQDSIRNKTTWMERVHHRATHSHDAFVASVVLTGLIVSILAGVYFSKMWRDKAHLAIQQKQPVHFEHYSKKTEMRVKGAALNG